MSEQDKQILDEIRHRHGITERLGIDIGDDGRQVFANAMQRHKDRASLLAILDSKALEIERLKKEVETLRFFLSDRVIGI